ncbi:MAG: hypothetical protein IPG70_02670 [Moraxellaceae bacterium]|nr:hypothetical protein [Moraxellaceae bacterium]
MYVVSARVVFGDFRGGVILSTSVQAAPLQICLDKNFNAPFICRKIKGAGQLRGYSLELIKIIMEKRKRRMQLKV